MSSSPKIEENVVEEEEEVFAKGLEKGSLLWEWATHTSESYHDFSEEEATAIRSALLKWYRSNRRKLPWRGDSGPFDGSTAGINQKKKTDLKGTKSIQSYFGKVKEEKTKRKSPRSKGKKEEEVKDHEQAIPVTGYGVWVSEIMLQQTRVEAVIPYYLAWMKSFPTVHDLAQASEDAVNAHWAGLGFYRRARLLHKGAKYVVNDLNGTVPETVDELMLIDGIGRYTASAVSSIAFNRCVPVVDGNVCRVLSRLKGIANDIKAPIFKDKLGWALAEQIVQAGNGEHAGDVNQALMELGATYCAPSGTGVDERDPLRDFYLSTRIGREVNALMANSDTDISDFVSKATSARGDKHCNICKESAISNILIKITDDLQNVTDNSKKNSLKAAMAGHDSFPIPPLKKPKREEILAVMALSSQKNSASEQLWLMIKRPKEGLLAGQWEFPNSCVFQSIPPKKGSGVIDLPLIAVEEREKALDELLEEYSSIGIYPDTSDRMMSWLEKDITHIFSHVRHTMYVQHGELHCDESLLSSETYLSCDGRELRWMGEKDMKNVGITSGVKKILAAVKHCRQ